jgi:hypothetical protein
MNKISWAFLWWRGSAPQILLEGRKGHDDDDSAEIGKIEFDFSYT